VFGNLGSTLPGHYPAINFVTRCLFDEYDMNPKQRVNASSYIPYMRLQLTSLLVFKEDLDVDGRIILRWVLGKWEGVETGWSWFRIGTDGGHL